MNENSDLYMWKNIIMIVAHLKNTMLLNHAPKQKKKKTPGHYHHLK